MKKFRRIIFIATVFILITSITASSANAAWLLFPDFFIKPYSVSDELQKKLNKIYNNYNFEIGWGLYDISGGVLKKVASYNTADTFQSNCTIKAAMLLCLCKEMDKGKLSLKDKLKVRAGELHYDDFDRGSGNYTVEYLIGRMIHVSNNACYEILLRYITLKKFNAFLKTLGSGTYIESYNYMGDCYIKDRAKEWIALYNYCHSVAKHASYAWDLLLNAKYSPIRDGVGRAAAHKSGWHYEDGVHGTAGDCAVVSTPNGGCYLMIMFTCNNSRGKYSQRLMRELAVVLDKVWNDYYDSIPSVLRPNASF
ncbi:MAG: class A beta-lactamase-related serine hydrolase [Clostridiales bacterium]|nr:class A beta-lactamase-related serine hydrolase [Clostridiales bacterium]